VPLSCNYQGHRLSLVNQASIQKIFRGEYTMKNKNQLIPAYADEKLAVFIDGANLYGAARSLDFDIDYRRLLQWAGSQGRLIRAYYYTVLIEDQEFSPIRPLVDWLDYNGYTMVTKTAREFTDSQGRRKIKGNMDIEVAIDMMEIAPHVDHIMLFSGDGDFRRLVETVQRKGVRVTVVSSVKSNPPMVADELRRQADHFLDLDLLADDISRAPAPAGSNTAPQRVTPTTATPSDHNDESDLDDDIPSFVRSR
jgi:uncharacterized LabA/DUF88 family protein